MGLHYTLLKSVLRRGIGMDMVLLVSCTMLTTGHSGCHGCGKLSWVWQPFPKQLTHIGKRGRPDIAKRLHGGLVSLPDLQLCEVLP